MSDQLKNTEQAAAATYELKDKIMGGKKAEMDLNQDSQRSLKIRVIWPESFENWVSMEKERGSFGGWKAEVSMINQQGCRGRRGERPWIREEQEKKIPFENLQGKGQFLCFP